MKRRRRREPARSISRVEAAQLLRNARRAWRSNPAEAGESISWALTALRDSHQARRLKVDFLLHIRNFDSADALMARCMMTDVDRPLLRLRFARSMFEQGRLEPADREIREALRARPGHGAALQLAAEIASSLDDLGRAVELYQAATSRKPRDLSIRSNLVRALLDHGQVSRAADILSRWKHAPPELMARWLRAEGRTLDALEMLESACDRSRFAQPGEPAREDHERVGTLLLELLDEVGAADSLAKWTHRFAQCGWKPAVLGANLLLSYGRFGEAHEILKMLAGRPSLEGHVAEATIVASALEGNVDAARAMLARLDHRCPSDRRAWARRWLRCWMGRLIADNTDGRVIGADPNFSVLQPLLAKAAETIDAALAAEPHLPAANQVRLAELLAINCHAIGRSDLSGAALARAYPPQTHILAA